ncbi:uncharacterized protein LOC128872275 [Hylaeus volcanicus]|uniref:uncharacterized protein LOC128872275 n=1 Tax=Hylaeus volcanicus TaxID=313075 RepID=UPI0023B86F08|nr:uncharacterized protein LOC128872275 [Hylaeus volcanicus]
MPSFLGHFFGLSFRTELLIMNLLGLVNSTLDWSPLKWTNELERIWNLSLSQSAIIIDVIGEDTIKTVLSWIVITRIVIAHVYTLTYVTNIYPIVTWSRPKLLLPWLILSFFKNVVLEVIVIVIGLLLWYDTRFSIVIFLEFIFVKLVPLLLAGYNWYTNSCLFLQLRHLEKLRKLKRSMRSDTNLLTSRLYAKLEDSKYRTRSLTTLLTCESFESYDTQDTISHIIDDPALSPVQKTMKLLGLSEHDITEARIRVRQRAERRRLTELDDEFLVPLMGHSNHDLERLFNANNEYQRPSTDAEVGKRNIDLDKVESTNEHPAEPELLFPPTENPEIEIPEVANPFEATEAEASRRSENEVLAEAKATSEPPLSRRKREGTGTLNTSRTKQMKMYSCYAKDLKTCTPYQKRKESSRLSSTRQTRRSMEESCSPMKLQALFNCNCTATDQIACCEVKDATLRTSTPKKNVDIPGGAGNSEDNSMDCPKAFDHSYVYTCSVTNVKTDFMVSSSYPETSTLLQKNLELFKSIKVDDLENLLAKEMSVQRVKQIQDDPNLLEPYSDHRNAVIDVQDLSEIVKDLSATNLETSRTAVSEVKADDDGVHKSPTDKGVDTTQKTTLHPDTPSTNKNDSKLNLPEHSFGDTNIPRFYKDSMMVFDGCYEKDFANNSEVQSLLRQLEKKEWNVFDDHTNLETLHRASYSKQDIGPLLQDLGTIHLLNDDSEKLEGASKLDPLISREAQADDPPVAYPPRESKKVPISDFVDSTKTSNVHTQTDKELQPSSSRSSLSEGKRRRRAYFKRKHLSEQSRSTSPCGIKLRARKTDTRFMVTNNRPKSPVAFARHKMAKPGPKDAKKKIDPTKSPSSNSVCECPMNKLEAKHGDTRKRDENRKSSTKPKVDTFGTVPLAQVARQSDIETMVYRRKPPVYPKEFKKEARDVVASSKMPSGKKTESFEYKRSTSKASNSSRTSKSKSGMDDTESREMRALKAYNEVTLLRDKEELEKKKLSSRRIAESQPRAQNSKLFDDYTNKENLLIDTATETNPSSWPEDGGQPSVTARPCSFSNVRYRSARMAKINRVTDRLLDNFDRLHVTQAKQESKKSKSAEPDGRKQYTKYSKPKKLVVEENLSVSSSKRLEGTQKGRDLERTLAKEDVRDETVRSIPATVESQQRVNVEFAIPGPQHTELLMLKPSANEDLASSCSSSTVDHREEIQTVLEESPNVEDEERAVPRIDEPEEQVVEELEAVDVEGDTRNHPETYEDEPQRPETRNASWNRTSPDLTDFIRNIDVNRLPHGVVLTNPIAQGKRSRQMDIVDDRTARMVHNAFSYKSMDSLLDFPADTVTMEDVLHGSHLDSSVDELVYRPRNEDVFVEELFEQGDQLEQAIVAAIRESQDANRDLCIVTIGGDILPDGSATEDVEDDAGRGRVVQMNEVLSSITEVLGGLNITGLDLDAIATMEFELLREILDAGEVQVPRNQVSRSKDVADEEEYSREQMLRIIEENVCTDIRFPVVIKMSDLIPGMADTRNSSPRVLVSRVDPVRMSFSRLTEVLERRERGDANEEKNEDEESLETRKEKEEKSLEEIMLSMMESMRLMNINDDGRDLSDSEDSFDDFRSESDTLTHVSLNSRPDSTIEEFPVDSLQCRETCSAPPRGGLNETFEIKRAEESSEEDVERVGETPREEEGASSEDRGRLGSITPEDLERSIEIKETEEGETDFERTDEASRDEEGITLKHRVGRIEKNIENDEASIIPDDLEQNIDIMLDECTIKEGEYFTTIGEAENRMKEKQSEGSIKPEIVEEGIEIEEAEEIVRTKATGRSEEFLEDEDIEEGLAMIGLEDTVEEENEVVSGHDVAELKDELSLQILFSFWLMVVYFYTRYFFQKIYSLSRISRATSMLKPFDVHAVSTSTSTLLEKAELAEKIRRESRVDPDTSDFENVDTSGAIEEHLRSVLNSTIEKICSEASLTGMEGIMEELREEVERTVLNMRDRVAEMMETVPSNRGVEETREEARSVVLSRERDRQQRCLFPIEVQTSDNDSSTVKESSAIATNTRLSIIELEEDELIDLRSTDREISTPRVEEVDPMEDDRVGSPGGNRLNEEGLDREEDSDATDVISQTTMIVEERVEAKSTGIVESDSSIDLETTRKEQKEHSDLQSAEREIATFRFTEVDRSSSLESLVEDDVGLSEKYRLIKKIYDEGLGKEECVSPGLNAEEAEKSAESVKETEKTGQNVASNSIIRFETTLEEMDSFDSAYTAFSETTQNSVSFADFVSAMEEFSIASNLSDEDA